MKSSFYSTSEGKCTHCNGTGMLKCSKIVYYRPDGTGDVVYNWCIVCGGTGEYLCTYCKGTGKSKGGSIEQKPTSRLIKKYKKVGCQHYTPCQHPITCQHPIPCNHSVPCIHLCYSALRIPIRCHANDFVHYNHGYAHYNDGLLHLNDGTVHKYDMQEYWGYE